MMDTLRSIIENVKIAFLYVLGRIKLYKWPMFVVYNHRAYDVRASWIRMVIDTHIRFLIYYAVSVR